MTSVDTQPLRAPISLRPGPDAYALGRPLETDAFLLRVTLSQQRNKKGQRFERTVAQRLQQLGYAPIRTRLRRVGSVDFRNIDGQDLGDIDIAAIHSGRNELLLLEVKDLETARTPAELTNEVNNLIGEGNSAIHRLRQRTIWVRQHLDATLRELGNEVSIAPVMTDSLGLICS